jgi:hypothetical protein
VKVAAVTAPPSNGVQNGVPNGVPNQARAPMITIR